MSEIWCYKHLFVIVLTIRCDLVVMWPLINSFVRHDTHLERTLERVLSWMNLSMRQSSKHRSRKSIFWIYLSFKFTSLFVVDGGQWPRKYILKDLQGKPDHWQSPVLMVMVFSWDSVQSNLWDSQSQGHAKSINIKHKLQNVFHECACGIYGLCEFALYHTKSK